MYLTISKIVTFLVLTWHIYTFYNLCIYIQILFTGDAPQDSSDIVSKAFTSVEEDGSEVQYVTMTPEEAAAAGVVEDEQVC